MNAAAPIVWFALLAAMFLILIVIPQRRRMQAFQTMQSRLRVGDEIVTTSGLLGVVRSLDDEVVEVEIAPATVVRFARQAVGRIIEPADTADRDAGSDTGSTERDA